MFQYQVILLFYEPALDLSLAFLSNIKTILSFVHNSPSVDWVVMKVALHKIMYLSHTNIHNCNIKNSGVKNQNIENIYKIGDLKLLVIINRN